MRAAVSQVAAVAVVGCGGQHVAAPLASAYGAGPRIAPAAVAVDAVATMPMASNVLPDQAYELCLVGGPSAARVCYLVARDNFGPRCGVLIESVDGVVGKRCAPPEDCGKVLGTLEASSSRASRNPDSSYLPVGPEADDAPETKRLIVLVPDTHPSTAAPNWFERSVDYDRARAPTCGPSRTTSRCAAGSRRASELR